jgi:hypothetical protein
VYVRPKITRSEEFGLVEIIQFIKNNSSSEIPNITSLPHFGNIFIMIRILERAEVRMSFRIISKEGTY